MNRTFRLVLLFLFTLTSCAATAAQRQGTKDEEQGPMSAKTFKGLALRGIGPALMSGRIADIAIHPNDPNLWYVAVGSGGVWKTENSGTTWSPVFDEQPSYSIGCVAVDPSNPHVVWVGTGENVGGRHVGFGDGIYRSTDDGGTWTNMGLKDSQHISKILIHPTDSNTVWVAVQGPLWSSGGQRGVFKTTDGGKTWTNPKVLKERDPWTGVTDLIIDPRDPNLLYAATWQHHRTVAAWMGGGEKSGIHRSLDGGETWERLATGLPEEKMGKIGLALSPIKPDVVYAAIELHRRTGGVWRSTNRGASWEKRSEAVSGGTGPHYYQELYASPHVFDRIYLADVFMKVSEDGGKTFTTLPSEYKHSDNHALAFRPDQPDYLLSGTDGGLYESFDHAKTWRFVDNLPVTQFYKLAVDDTEPFYTVYGGTQDNNTQGGPSRTTNVNGIRNADWFITVFADGHQPAVEPGNPDIMYSEWQQGNLVRVDRTNGEIVYIQPQPGPNDPPERFNWDAPILVSPHSPTRLYYGSQRVWRSNNRGDTWEPVSGDLTRNLARIEQPILGTKPSWDAPWDLLAMSMFSTITSIAESPVDSGVLYAGTDDGLIQISEDDGANWRRVEVGSLPGVPPRAFVNDIKADLFDANTVYVALDNHKEGDFKPYLLKSTNRGRSWRSMTGDLPDRHLVWRLVQDHVNRELFFAATEFGIFFSVDGGSDWTKLTGGVPTISFRDLAIQRRENDLVGASFGRGFFVLDDYSPLRNVSAKALEQEALLLPTRDARWYIEERPLGRDEKASQGHGYFVAPNPPFGAVFTYYLKEDLQTRKDVRQEAEKKARENDQPTPFPGWEAVEAERRESPAEILLTVSSKEGEVVRRLSGPVKAGMHRVAWDLRYPAVDPVGLERGPFDDPEQGFLVAPGDYTVSLSKRVDGKITALGEAQSFRVVPMRGGALKGDSPEQVAAFWRRISKVQRGVQAAQVAVEKTAERMKNLSQVLARTQSAPGSLDAQFESLRLELDAIRTELSGSASKNEVGAQTSNTVYSRLGVAYLGTFLSTYGPTPAHEENLDLAEHGFASLRKRLNTLILKKVPSFEQQLQAAFGPWAPGQPIP